MSRQPADTNQYRRNRKVVLARGICLRCGRPGRTTKLTSDHIIPYSHGGTADIWNLQCLCQECNKWKANRYIDFTGQSGVLRTPLYELNNYRVKEMM